LIIEGLNVQNLHNQQLHQQIHALLASHSTQFDLPPVGKLKKLTKGTKMLIGDLSNLVTMTATSWENNLAVQHHRLDFSQTFWPCASLSKPKQESVILLMCGNNAVGLINSSISSSSRTSMWRLFT
jgi:hypothetical protein